MKNKLFSIKSLIGLILLLGSIISILTLFALVGLNIIPRCQITADIFLLIFLIFFAGCVLLAIDSNN